MEIIEIRMKYGSELWKSKQFPEPSHRLESFKREFLAGPVVGALCFLPKAPVQPLVEKLRSHKPHSVAKKKKREGGLQGIVNVQMMGDGYHETPNSGEDGLFTELSSQDGISHWDRETR